MQLLSSGTMTVFFIYVPWAILAPLFTVAMPLLPTKLSQLMVLPALPGSFLCAIALSNVPPPLLLWPDCTHWKVSNTKGNLIDHQSIWSKKTVYTNLAGLLKLWVLFSLHVLYCEDKLNLLGILLLYACTAVHIQHYCGVHCWFWWLSILSSVSLCLFLFYHPMSIIEEILYLQCISILAALFCIWSTFAYLKRFCVCTVLMYLQCVLIFEAHLCIWCAYVYLKCVFCIWGTFAYLKSVSVVTPHFCICSTFAPVGHCTIYHCPSLFFQTHMYSNLQSDI